MPGKSSLPLDPYTRADPKRSTAEPKLPMTRYLSAASSPPRRSRSIAQRMYSEIENHSSARNNVIRLFAATKNAIPAPAAASRE
jgi:hypothetical protein